MNAVSLPPDDAARQRAPLAAEPAHGGTALLVIEVSDSTLDFDLRTKKRLYAAAGIPEYWIINLVSRRLEVFRSPTSGSEPTYAQSLALAATDTISPLAAPHATVAIASLLP